MRSRKTPATPDQADTEALRNELITLDQQAYETGRIDVDKILRAARAGVAATGDDNPDHGFFQFFLGTGLLIMGDRNTDESALAQAVQALRTAVILLPESDDLRPAALSTLANALQARSAVSDDPEVLAEAVETAQAALAAFDPDHPLRPVLLLPLAKCLRALGDHAHDLTALREAVTVSREAVDKVDPDAPFRHGCLFVLGWCLRSLFDETKDPDTLTEAIANIRAAIESAPSDNPEVSAYQLVLGAALEEQFDLTGDPDFLAQSIAADRASGITNGDPKHALDLAALARRLVVLAGRTGSLDTLIEAAQAWRSAVAATPADDSDYAWRQSRLRQVLESLFARTGDPALLREAVAAGQAALAAAPDHSDYPYDLAKTWHSLFQVTGELTALTEVESLMRALIALPDLAAADRAAYLTALSVALHLRYEQINDPESLAEAIALQREAIVLDPDDPTSLSNLGAALGSQFELSGDLDALTEGLSVCRAAVAATPPDDPDRGVRLGNLAGAALNLFLHTADRAALTEAVDAARAASTLVSAGRGSAGTDDARQLNNLMSTLNAVFVETGDQAVLAEAVQVGQAAVAAMPAGYPYRARVQSSHAATLATAYLSTGDYDLLVAAVDLGRAAVADRSGQGAEDANYLSNLAVILITAYGRTGDLATLAEAVEVGRAGVALCGPEQPLYPRYESNFAIALATLYMRTGGQSLVAEALDAARKAVSATPEMSPDRARCQANLGTVLLFLYLSTGELEALHRAVEATQAAAVIGPEHSIYGLTQANLAQELSLLYQRTGAKEALAQAEQAVRAAVGVMAAGQPWYAVVLSALGAILFNRYGEDERSETLDEAIATLRTSEAVAIGRDPNRVRSRFTLCTALNTLFDETGDLELLTEAATIGRGAVTDIGETGPSYALAAVVLGRTLRRLHAETGQPETIAEARAVLAKAAQSVSPVQERVLAGLEQARAQTLAGDDPAAAAAMEDVIALMPLVAPSLLRRNDREHRLGETAGVGEVAAATALAAGRPDRAVELLEQARGLLLAEAMDARVNLARLRRQAPELADEFEQRRRQSSSADLPLLIAPETGALPLAPVGRQSSPEAGQGDEPTGDAADSALLAKIRALPGLADFLTVPSAAQLSQHAKDGPVVMVSAAWNRGDALILTPDPAHPVLHVPLPGLTDETATAQARKLFAALRAAATDPSLAAYRQAQIDLHEILAWLWDTITEPVLTAVGYTAQPTGQRPWPRLWWSPVGTLTFLPMHAAGHHLDPGGGRTVLDRVISSYTATIRALAYSRQTHPAPTPNPNASADGYLDGPADGTPNAPADGYLIVAMPQTPDEPALFGVEREATAVAAMLPGATVLSGPNATHDRVVDAMRASRVAHFACHGISDWRDPGRNRLLLQDHETNPLTVGAISRLQLASPDLAYLSACSTTDTSLNLADEAVHITSAFQLAGYRNVIGTLWPVSDDAATEIAENVYAHLTSNGTQPPDTAAAARALHLATRRLRAEYPKHPTAWAAHIHTGR